MNSLPEDLISSFKKYDAMQEAHLKFIETESLPDMKTCNFERAKAFEDLKNHLSIVLKGIRRDGGNALQIFAFCQEKLASIMEREEILARRIRQYRHDLEQALQQMRQGKKALQGYGRSGSNHSPRFVNEPG